jgi:hypothetical protein
MAVHAPTAPRRRWGSTAAVLLVLAQKYIAAGITGGSVK